MTLSALLLLGAALSPALPAAAAPCFLVDAELVRTVDGDTFDAKLTVFPTPWGLEYRTERVRVYGIDTPERGQPNYLEAKAFTDRWLAVGPFQVRTCGYDTLRSRIVGVVTRGADVLAEDLKAAGFAKP